MPIDNDNVVLFPRQPRVVSLTEDTVQEPLVVSPIMVEHDGRIYRLADLLRVLTNQETRLITSLTPRSGQEVWNAIVRHWPRLADDIMSRASYWPASLQRTSHL